MEARIAIHGPIGESADFQGITLANVISQVKAAEGATSLTVSIDSPGGNLQTGFDIFNYLKSTGLPIKMVGRGMVASVATVIFMAGSTRILQEGTMFMIHLPYLPPGSAGGTSEELKQLAKESEQVENRVIKFYQDVMQIDKEAIRNLLRTESYLTEAEAFNLGFTTVAEPLKMVALFEAGKKSNSKNKDMKDPKKAKGLLAKMSEMIVNFLEGGDEQMLVVYTADQQEIEFPDLADGATPEVGAQATIDGQPADGTFTDADGNTLTFENGELTDWTEAGSEEEEEETMEELQQKLTDALADLDIANAKVVDLTEENATMKAELETANKEVEQAREIVTEIQGMHSELVKEINGKAPSGSRQKKKKRQEQMSVGKKALASYRQSRTTGDDQ